MQFRTGIIWCQLQSRIRRIHSPYHKILVSVLWENRFFSSSSWTIPEGRIHTSIRAVVPVALEYVYSEHFSNRAFLFDKFWQRRLLATQQWSLAQRSDPGAAGAVVKKDLAIGNGVSIT